MVLAWLAACSSYSSDEPPAVPLLEAGVPTPDAAPAVDSGETVAEGGVDVGSDAAIADAGTDAEGGSGGVDAAKTCVSTLEKPPTQAVSLGAGTSWQTPTAVYGPDNNSADADLTNANRTSETLYASGFGFAVPASATVVGVVVRIRGRSSESDDDVRDDVVRLAPGGQATGVNKAAKIWHETTETINYGSASDVWGLQLTPQEVNAPTFGVGYVARYHGASSGTMRVDQMTMTITYCQ